MAENSLAEILERSTRRCRDADAPLAERLKLFADDVRSLSPDFAEVVERMIGRLQSSGAGLSAPSTGDTMPPFLLPNQDGELVSLEQLLAQAPLVIAPFRFSPISTMAMRSLSIWRFGLTMRSVRP